MIRLRVLGSADLVDEAGHSVHTLLAQPKRIALLAVLSTAGSGDFLHRDTVAALFWPENDHEHARAGLRTALHALRRALGEIVATRGNDEVGIVRELLWCDATAFEAACAAEEWDEAL